MFLPILSYMYQQSEMWIQIRFISNRIRKHNDVFEIEERLTFFCEQNESSNRRENEF